MFTRIFVSFILLLAPMTLFAKTETAVFAGGCFWCMQSDFDKMPGIIKTTVGYDGGTSPNPTYEEVSSGSTHYVESISIEFDSAIIQYPAVLNYFWHHIDPTVKDKQFCDVGRQYRTAIFYLSPEQQQAAHASKIALEKQLGKPFHTEITASTHFYPAEEYHQDYYKKNPIRYNYYRHSCGRDARVKEIWGNVRMPNNYQAQINALTPLQKKVTQAQGTEPPFQNAYWNNEAPGIYVDVVSGEPLFSSTDKFDSGTGWPSFTKPINAAAIVTREDRGIFSTRTEVRSTKADSHLGHVFDDGPKPTGLRYCMNSAALRFISAKDLAKEGYGEYIKLFEKK